MALGAGVHYPPATHSWQLFVKMKVTQLLQLLGINPRTTTTVPTMPHTTTPLDSATYPLHISRGLPPQLFIIVQPATARSLEGRGGGMLV